MCSQPVFKGPYTRYVVHTGTHMITLINKRWAWLVLGVTPREYEGCCWKVLPHLVALIRVGRGIPQVKSYK
jgi:hypothetical protein